MYDVISLGSCIAELTPSKSGVPLSQGGTFELLPAGSSANFAFAAAKLGLKAALVSRIGEDELGQFILTRLRQAGVDTSHVAKTIGQLTSLSFSWADGSGAKQFYFYRFPGFSDPLSLLTSEEVEDAFLQKSQLLHFSEACVRDPQLRKTTFEIVERFRRLGGKVLYCPNYRGVWRCGQEEMLAVQRHAISLANLVILNEEEAAVITGDKSAASGAELRNWGPEAVVITRGKDGALLFSEEETGSLPAFEVPVVYDVGAGDTFQAGFVAGRAWGFNLLDSVRAGAAAAAIRISRSGDPQNLPSEEEAKRLLSERK